MINRLTAEELYSTMANQIAMGWTTTMPNLPVDFTSVFSDCATPIIRKNFSTQEMRELFIQPVGMNKSYYDKKLSNMRGNIEKCFNKAAK